MILSDVDLKKAIEKGKIRISPFDPDLIGPSGLDLKLGYQMRIFRDVKGITELNPFEEYGENLTQVVEPDKGKFIIPPGELVLAASLERIEMPDDLVARLIPRSSFSRLGIFLLSGSGTIEPGFKGHLTLALENIGKIPVILYPEMPFCKLVFEALSSSAAVPYSRKKPKYQEQEGPEVSRLYLEKKE